VPFPEGYGATVHFFWPGKGSQVLGMYVLCPPYILSTLIRSEYRLSNEKPSAIFRLRSTFSSMSNPASGMSTPSAFTSAASTTTGDVTAILGFAVEPVETVAAQIAALPAASINATLNANVASAMTKQVDLGALAERIARHLLNYVSGFVPSGGMGPDSMVPMGIVAKWYENFTGKLRAGGTGFLEREE
jgi:hypothetical protein